MRTDPEDSGGHGAVKSRIICVGAHIVRPYETDPDRRAHDVRPYKKIPHDISGKDGRTNTFFGGKA